MGDTSLRLAGALASSNESQAVLVRLVEARQERDRLRQRVDDLRTAQQQLAAAEQQLEAVQHEHSLLVVSIQSSFMQ